MTEMYNPWRAAVCAALLVVTGLGCGAGTITIGGDNIDPQQQKPVVSRFVATPDVLPAGGGDTVLTWDVSGADSVSISPDVGSVTGSSKTVRVVASTVFMLTATNAAGSVTRAAGVIVGADSPLIASFSAAPTTVPPGGGSTTLSWSVAGADSLSISPNVGTVTGSSVQVTVSSNTTFTLQATNAQGTNTATTTVTVSLPTSDVHVAISPTNVGLNANGAQQFTATVTGTTNTAVVWSASGGSITTGGAYSAPGTDGGYIVRATSVADPNSSASATVTVTGGGAVLDPFYRQPYVQVMTPMPGATYFAPATIRVWAHAPYFGSGSANGYAPQVDFYLGTTNIGTVTRGSNDPIDYYEVMKTGVAAGSYEIYARTVTPDGSRESVHVPITVIDVPAHGGPNLALTSDRVLSGSENFEILGTPSARALVTSSNGSRIRSAPGWSGHLTIRNADIIGLGAMDIPGIEVTVQGTNTLEISGSVFDRSGPLSLTANDQAPVILQGNTIQPNTLTPVNDQADYAGSHPSITVAGNSSAAKRFQGNNVGVSFVRFSTNHWLIGGDTNTDGNVILGVRATIELNNSVDNTIRGNFLYHRYPYGWSQGHLLDFEGSTSPVVVEHNVFRGASWMIQSMDGDFRYNLLIDNINEAFFRYTAANTKIHHNVLINVGYQRVYYPTNGLLYLGNGTAVYNNTIDVGGAQLGWVNYAMIQPPASGGNVRSNIFTGFAYQSPNAVITAGLAYGDYNCFYNPDTSQLTRYGDGGHGAHDCGGGSADPKFAQARIVPFPFGDGDIWARRVTVSQILAFYRGVYTPTAGSPVIDLGDPSDDTGGFRNTDIGAVGAGNAHPDDRFGTFGN